MRSPENIRIQVGDGTVSATLVRPAHAVGMVVVAPGAGSSFDHPFLVGFTQALHEADLGTLRFNFPYREAGRRLPDRAPTAIKAWRAAMAVAASHSPGEPVWAAGKSFGGRMASMAVAEGMPAAGLIFLGYPLHPPGKPESLRDAHLYGLELPMLFLQGTRDPFAAPSELDPVVERIGASATLQWIDDANHSFEVRGAKLPPAEVGASLAPRVAAFVRGRP
ncbi:MAG: alpha/beta family hydrolase [Cryobacterium sp.]